MGQGATVRNPWSASWAHRLPRTAQPALHSVATSGGDEGPHAERRGCAWVGIRPAAPSAHNSAVTGGQHASPPRRQRLGAGLGIGEDISNQITWGGERDDNRQKAMPLLLEAQQQGRGRK
jgi:hypothetical protein